MTSLVDVYRARGVPHVVDDARGGWISTHCCHCVGSADFHLGYSVAGGYFRCWRCGFHRAGETLAKILGVSLTEAMEIHREIRGHVGGVRPRDADRAMQARIGIRHYRHPDDVGPMRANHRRYLERRGFDPDEIAARWDVLGTGPASYLNGIDYGRRLLVPIRWGGAEVSFQARDVTGRSERKYVACPPERETVHHKCILYGDECGWGGAGIIVEGVTDAWRFGDRAVAVFGVRYRPEQAREIARRFERVSIVFDPEPAAQDQARKLAATLRLLMDREVPVVDIGGKLDPGSLPPDDARHLARELTR